MQTGVLPTMTVNPETCTGCHMCVMMCSLSRTGEFNASRARVAVRKRGGTVRKDVPFICRQCADAPCAAACPIEAISRDSATSAVLVDHDICNLCEACIAACPYDAIWLQKDKIVMCDLCGGKPVCVRYCSYGTLQYPMEEETYDDIEDDDL
ncbi:MAG: 4Fe-4S binding protein [Chloroflexi bacterium]|nr:4Fe-4S binding protein [Chloroflexota bacterium]